MFEGRKAAIKNFNIGIDPEYVALVKPIDKNLLMIAAHEKLAELEKAKKEIVGKIDIFYYGPKSGSDRVPGKEVDAAALLAGTPVKELSGQSKDTELQNLVRQREALRTAVSMQEQAILLLESRLVSEGCKDAGLRKWKIENEVKPQIAVCEKLIDILKKKEVYNQFLGHCGYSTNLRPPGFLTTAYEQFILFGGQMGSLQGHIDWLKKVWKLDE